jgi:hypothetical protein
MGTEASIVRLHNSFIIYWPIIIANADKDGKSFSPGNAPEKTGRRNLQIFSEKMVFPHNSPFTSFDKFGIMTVIAVRSTAGRDLGGIPL